MTCKPRQPLDDSWLFADPMTLALVDEPEEFDGQGRDAPGRGLQATRDRDGQVPREDDLSR